MPKISAEFSMGIVVAILLVLIAPRLNAAWTVILLVVATVLCLHSTLSIPWIWSAVSGPMIVWRVSLVSAVVLLALGYLGISVWPQREIGNLVAPPSGPPILDDVTWNFDHFLGMTGGGGFEILIDGFQVHGRNNLDRAIKSVKGVWRSDLNNKELPVVFIVDGQRVAPENTTGIPMRTEFDIGSAQLPSTDPPREGVVESKFFSVFGPFTLELEYDGKRVVHHFSKEDILKQLNDSRSVVVSGSKTPSVSKSPVVVPSGQATTPPPFLPASPSSPAISISQGTGSIAQLGGQGNQATINNVESPDRHLTADQIAKLDSFAVAMPDDSLKWFEIQSINSPESQNLALEMESVFRKHSKTNTVIVRLAESGQIPRGIFVLVAKSDEHFLIAEQLANLLNGFGSLNVHFESSSTPMPPGSVKLIVARN